MAIINFANREITAKVVYFGASGAGCNVNLTQLHKALGAAEKSQLHKFGPSDSDERTYYFDYLTDQADAINGFQVRYQVYSLPGGLDLDAHREEVMRDTDALVFVSDARAERANPNMDSLLELERLLSAQGLELAALPVVMQVNHVDSNSARNTGDVVFDLNPYGFPVISAVASESRGVVETHEEITGATIARIRDNMAGNEATITLTAVHRATRLSDEDVIRAHIEAIQGATASTPASETHGMVTNGEGVRAAGPAVEVPFQPHEFVGSHPIQIQSTRIQDGHIELDVVMEPMSGGPTRTLTVILANRPTDTPPVPRHAPPSVVPAEDRVRNYLPEVVHYPQPASTDFPPLLYGLLGVVGGMLIGLLGGYLLGFLF